MSLDDSTIPWVSSIRSFAERYALTAQERRVLILKVAGQHGKGIASSLSCTESTVSTYWKRIFRKTSCSGQAEVLAALLRHQTVDGSANHAPAERAGTKPMGLSSHGANAEARYGRHEKGT
jgi:DNA-binding CsgD family transcriptional regulator